MQRLLMLGLNHTTAPLEVRERLAFTSQQQREAIESLRTKFPEAEFVLVSSCNRVEMYIGRQTHGHPRSEEVIEFLSQFHGIGIEQFKPHLYERSEKDVVRHLFAVTSSLDSMVLGEHQILGQVRDAYELSKVTGLTSGLLHPLFQRAIAVGKQVMTDTPLGEGRVSISGVAVSYARRIFDHFGDKTVLCIGAGKMSLLAMKGFAALNPKKLVVCNRDVSKAETIAAELNGVAVGLDQLDDQLVAADIVVTSTGATQPIITRKQFEHLLKLRRYRPIFIIDIAVPRDVEPAVGELEHVYLYNLDDLQKAVAETQNLRGDAVAAARQIVDEHVEQFVAWQRQRELGPVIDQLYKRCHELAAEEVARIKSKLPSLSQPEKEHLDELARRIVNKMLHDPVQALRDGETLHSPASQYLHALQRMFRLEEMENRDESAG